MVSSVCGGAAQPLSAYLRWSIMVNEYSHPYAVRAQLIDRARFPQKGKSPNEPFLIWRQTNSAFFFRQRSLYPFRSHRFRFARRTDIVHFFSTHNKHWSIEQAIEPFFALQIHVWLAEHCSFPQYLCSGEPNGRWFAHFLLPPDDTSFVRVGRCEIANAVRFCGTTNARCSEIADLRRCRTMMKETKAGQKGQIINEN